MLGDPAPRTARFIAARGRNWQDRPGRDIHGDQPLSDNNPASLDWIKELISFDTTSRNSNLDLIHRIQGYLEGLGVISTLTYDDAKQKANLYATLGPQDRPGILLSGHTDVVPVDVQDWDTDPFQVFEKEGRLYGRGTCDMKSFVAVCLAYAPKFLAKGLETPIHFAFSYDEEVGCIGVRRLVDMLADMPIKPTMCIVGEPTDMQVMISHKGKYSYRAHVRGLEAHSSLAPHGVNAVEYAAETITYLKGMARRIAAEGPFDEEFDVPHTTVHTGTIHGGTALNIVPKDCQFDFEFRHLPDHDAAALFAEVETYIRETLEPEMQAIDPSTGFSIEELSSIPGLDMDPGAEVVTFAKTLAERNDHAKVAFGTEAGLFQQRVGIPTVVCGPGGIDQAHKPNEFVTIDQVRKCETFMDRLLTHVCGDT
jgi:acetylornithine deacetylase